MRVIVEVRELVVRRRWTGVDGEKAVWRWGVVRFDDGERWLRERCSAFLRNAANSLKAWRASV
jgi:hypothetical protein